jgi:phosphoribosylaminoimidazolecarboxamide formyltransferase/IMP cyclohydrolase
MKRALISVYNKAHLDKLVPFLETNGYNIYSTGGTYNHISGIIQNKTQLNNINEAFDISEQCDGRVKTIHPGIFSGILDKNEVFFNLVVVNLYPFLEEPGIEHIDIGGYSLIRSSIKNHNLVTILTEPNEYIDYIDSVTYIDDTSYMRHLKLLPNVDDNLKFIINKYFAKQAAKLLANDADAIREWL